MEMLLASGTDCTVGVPSPDMVPDTGMGRSKPSSLASALGIAVLDSWTNSMGVGPAANLSTPWYGCIAVTGRLTQSYQGDT